MAKLGNWTTIDATTGKQEEAEQFLRAEFEKIGGRVRKVINDHDFGGYPSFEIDKPSKFDEVDGDADYDDFHFDGDQDEETETPSGELLREWEEWIIKANKIEEDYSKKFADYL